jgi:hypothetical protein
MSLVDADAILAPAVAAILARHDEGEGLRPSHARFAALLGARIVSMATCCAR